MTTTASVAAVEVAHLVGVVRDEQPWGLGFRAECGCGWSSSWCDYQADAEAAGVDHQDTAAGPGDGLDRVMSDLLDLQDSLAEVVVWLAENWSADLPVPTLYGSGGDGRSRSATVEVWAYCGDPGDLVCIAQLLGVPVVEGDPIAGEDLREACRAFGRVVLRAYTLTEPGPGW